MSAPAPSPSDGASPVLASLEVASPALVSSELDSYAAIEAFAEHELELAGRGDVEALESHASAWEALTSSLPDTPPPAARPFLERATHMHERAHIELLRIREALVSELADIGHVSRAAHGYAPVASRRPRVDRSA